MSCRKYLSCSGCWDVYADISDSHASIDAATRAARGLPEDLIRLCVGIEDPADLIDDLERALLEAGAITTSASAGEHQYVRATIQREGVSISRAVEKLAFTENVVPKRPKENREWFVSAPGKVILFGEHAAVYGVVSAGATFAANACTKLLLQPAVAAAVGLRCYGLTSPRHDGKLSLRFADLGDFYHDWELNGLPWDAVTPIGVGDKHPDSLDQKLVDAILKRAMPPETNENAKAAIVTFLYLYMVMAHGGERQVF